MENIEDMLSQLISMVGNMRTEQAEVKEEISDMKNEITGMKSDMSGMKEETTGVKQIQAEMKQEQSQMRLEQTEMNTVNDKRHREFMDEFKILKADQDHTWKKTVQNERDIAILKHQFSN